MRPLTPTRLGLSLPPPEPCISATYLQDVRCQLARALADADAIPDKAIRMRVERSLLRMAAAVGCIVCGKPIRFEELEICVDLRRIALLHLWGDCPNRLARALGCTVDEACKGVAFDLMTKGT